MPALASRAHRGDMAVTAQPAPASGELNREQLLEMLREMSEVASVELKMTVPAEQRLAIEGLKVDFLQGRIREVYFFDTPELGLFHAGVVARARRTQGAPDDSVVKLRPVRVGELSGEGARVART